MLFAELQKLGWGVPMQNKRQGVLASSGTRSAARSRRAHHTPPPLVSFLAFANVPVR